MTEIHEHLKRMSYSSSTLLHSCPRKYELYKMGQKINVQEMWKELDTPDTAVPTAQMEGDVHTDFGSLVGDATQYYMIGGDLEATIFRMFIQWARPLEDESNRSEKRKSFYHAVYALQQFVAFRNSALSQWDVATFNGKPAIELGYTIDCGDGFFTRGFLDALLVNKLTGGYAVYEGKTTGAKFIDEAMYRNSGQGLGYDLVLETLTGKQQESYPVFYSVYMSSSQEWHLLPFQKSKLGRANWIRNLLIDKQHIAEYAENEHFPMHGESCFSYNRQCKYFGTCEMSNIVLGLDNVEVVPERDADRYTLHYSLQEIIMKQLEKLEDM